MDTNRSARTKAILTRVGAVILVLAFVAILGLLFPERMSRAIERTQSDVWDKPYFEIGDTPFSLALAVKLVLFIVLLAVLSRVARSFVGNQVLSHLSLEESQRYSIERITEYLLFAVGFLIGLKVLGIDLSSLALVGGALGIGIGFGLQAIVANFVSGLVLLVERPIKVGDRVEAGPLNGDVVRILARSTWIRTNDNVVIIIPNTELINNQVINWTANDRQIRFTVSVGVAYGSDPLRVRELLLEVARTTQDVLETPPPEVQFSGVGDSSLNFDLRVWTVSEVRRPGVLKSELYFKMFSVFKANGIEIPFPQRDLHLRTWPEQLSAAIAPGNT